MMTIVVRELWPRLQAILATYGEKFGSIDPALIRDIGCTENDAFLLRGYLTLRKHADGDELAIIVDVQSDDHLFIIKSDACADDGRVFAVGPSASIPLSDGQLKVEAALDDWIVAFEKFLRKSEKIVRSAVYQLH